MLKPVGDNIILEVIEQEAVSAGGIVLPGTAVEKPHRGRVLAANPSYYTPTGAFRTSEIAPGDVVLFGKTHGTEVKFEGKPYLVISEEFILCKEPI
uniref:co-chaperone GroES n=1 Tax=Marinobacterium profundum TaxID=1714300 RepID=UPI0008325C38|nr:co-chaperone GroES [Marinobacterium profundum]